MKDFFSIGILSFSILTIGCEKEDQFCSSSSFVLIYEIDGSTVTVNPILNPTSGSDYITASNGGGGMPGSDSVELSFGSSIRTNAGLDQVSFGISTVAKEHGSIITQDIYYSDYNDFKSLFMLGPRNYYVNPSSANSFPPKTQVSISIVYGQPGQPSHQVYSTGYNSINNSNPSKGIFNITDNCTSNDPELGKVEIVEGNFSCTLYNGSDSLIIDSGSFICYFKNHGP